jgi:hypothetical protein
MTIFFKLLIPGEGNSFPGNYMMKTLPTLI